MKIEFFSFIYIYKLIFFDLLAFWKLHEKFVVCLSFWLFTLKSSPEAQINNAQSQGYNLWAGRNGAVILASLRFLVFRDIQAPKLYTRFSQTNFGFHNILPEIAINNTNQGISGTDSVFRARKIMPGLEDGVKAILVG